MLICFLLEAVVSVLIDRRICLTHHHSSFFLLSGKYYIKRCRSDSISVPTPGQACLSVSVRTFLLSFASFRKKLYRPWLVEVISSSKDVGLTVFASHAGIEMFSSSLLRVFSFFASSWKRLSTSAGW